MAKHLKTFVCMLLAFAMVVTTGAFADCKSYADETESLYDRLSVHLTDAVYDYLDEIYIEKYPEMGLRFKYGDEKDRLEMQTLADLITEGKTDDMDKAKAICRWVKASLTYGGGSPYPIDTLRNRSGVCLNYSLLASQLMRLAGIPSVVVDGHRGGLKEVSLSDLRYSGHAWVYAHINGEWVMFDPLWSAGTPFTQEDKEFLASFYLIETIEGIFITFDGMDLYDINLFSSGARGDGPVYYQGRFKYVFNGQIDGDYYRPTDLGNSSYSVNGISQNVTLRVIKDGGIQDGNYYVGDIDNERRSQMIAGELYTNGWLTSGNYLYENGVAATGKIETVGDKTIYFNTNTWEINADEDDFWMKDGRVAFRTGTTGYELLKDYEPEPSENELICEYSLELVYDSDEGGSTVTEDGYFDLCDPGFYSLEVTYYHADDYGLAGFTSVPIYVEDERPGVDYTAGTLDISEFYVELSGDTFMYTGEEIKPEVTVLESTFSVGGSRPALTEGEDYTIEYKDNILPGYAQVIITGKGIFSGTTTASFYIDHEHIWDDGSGSEIPDNACENEWLKELICTICGEKKYEPTAPLGHSWGEWETLSEPTCMVPGDKMRQCSVCGLSEFESIPVTGHSIYLDESISISPTCTEPGTNYYCCRNCDYNYQETVKALGHNWGADGKCTRCGAIQQSDGWVMSADGIWHYYKNGTLATGWLKVGGSWYYMDGAGNMQTGWQKIGGTWYYFKSGGQMVTGWQKIGNTWYFFKSGGAMVTGWYKDGSTWYFFKSSGAMAANEWCGGYWLNKNGSWTYKPKGSWHQSAKGWWFGDTSGWYARNTTIKIDNKNYTFNASGYWVK